MAAAKVTKVAKETKVTKVTKETKVTKVGGESDVLKAWTHTCNEKYAPYL